MDVQFYPLDYIDGWNDEVTKLIPYTSGDGVDVGCGGRSPCPEQIRVDSDPAVMPDEVAEADKLPFHGDQFDYLTALHTLEHMKDPIVALIEWLRVVKDGGYVLIVVPDRTFTCNRANPYQHLEGNELMRHYTEYNLPEFTDFINDHKNLGYTVIESGEVGNDWALYAVLRKNFQKEHEK